MNKEKIKVIIAWLSLIFLIFLFVYVNYVKFFKVFDDSGVEGSVEESSTDAIDNALSSIVDNFNSNELVEKYLNEGIKIQAVLNNNSIFISYDDDGVTTYEFSYSNLKLNINITNESNNIDKYNKVYKILIEAIQKRIGNDDDISELINDHINNNVNYDGLVKNVNDDIIKYDIDITRKLKKEEIVME